MKRVLLAVLLAAVAVTLVLTHEAQADSTTISVSLTSPGSFNVAHTGTRTLSVPFSFTNQAGSAVRIVTSVGFDASSGWSAGDSPNAIVQPGETLTSSVTLLLSGAMTTGDHVVTVQAQTQNDTGAIVATTTATTHVSITKNAEVVLSFSSVPDETPRGGSATFYVYATETAGWDGSVSTTPSASCAGSADHVPYPASVTYSTYSSSVPADSDGRQIGTFTADVPSDLSSDWDSRILLCTVSTTIGGSTISVPAPPGGIKPGSGATFTNSGASVSLVYNVGGQAKLHLQFADRFPDPVKITPYVTRESYYSSYGYDLEPVSDLSVYPGTTSGEDLVLDVPSSASSSETLDLALDITSLTTGTAYHSHTSGAVRTLTINTEQLHDLAVTFTPSIDKYALGQPYSVPINAHELGGWSSSRVTAYQSSACGNVPASWNPQISIADTTVPAGGTFAVGTMTFTIPKDIPPDQWNRGQRASCAIAVSTPDLSPTTRSSSTFDIDPDLPATLRISGVPTTPISFVFDQPKASTSTFAYPGSFPLSVQNVGENPFSGTLTLSGSAQCPLEVTTGPAFTIPPLESRAATGHFVVSATHSAEHCVAQGADLGNVASNGIPQLPSYDVTYSAGVTAQDVTLPKLSIGDPSDQATSSVGETLGYRGVLVHARAVPVSDAARDIEHVHLNILDVYVGPSGTATANVAVTADRGAHLGCEARWQVTWDASGDDIPHFAAPTTTVTVPLAATGTDKTISDAQAVLSVSSADTYEHLIGMCSPSPQEDAARAAIEAGVRFLKDANAALNQSGPDSLDEKASASSTFDGVRAQLDDALAQVAGDPELEPAVAEAQDSVGAHSQSLITGIKASAQSARDIDQLKSAIVALEFNGERADDLQKELDQAYAKRTADDAATAQSVNELFGYTQNVSYGLSVASGFDINMNPLAWSSVHDAQVKERTDAAAALADYKDYGPMTQRVQAASIEANAAVTRAEHALVFGTVIDAALAIGLVGLGTRVLVRYGRDLAEVSVGSGLFA